MVARDSVLVTGAYGLVGRPTVERLVADGFKVTATVHHTTKPALPAAVDVRPVDLTEPAQIKALVADVSPSAIVHLAAVLPPQCYANPALARESQRRRHGGVGACGGGNWRRRLASCMHRASPCTAAATPTGMPTCSLPKVRWWHRMCIAATRVRRKTSCAHRIWNGRSCASAA